MLIGFISCRNENTVGKNCHPPQHEYFLRMYILSLSAQILDSNFWSITMFFDELFCRHFDEWHIGQGFVKDCQQDNPSSSQISAGKCHSVVLHYFVPALLKQFIECEEWAQNCPSMFTDISSYFSLVRRYNVHERKFILFVFRYYYQGCLNIVSIIYQRETFYPNLNESQSYIWGRMDYQDGTIFGIYFWEYLSKFLNIVYLKMLIFCFWFKTMLKYWTG